MQSKEFSNILAKVCIEDFGILGARPLTFINYSDADFAGSLLDRKSTSRTYQVLGQYLVS